jgi:hypothetical protein
MSEAEAKGVLMRCGYYYYSPPNHKGESFLYTGGGPDWLGRNQDAKVYFVEERLLVWTAIPRAPSCPPWLRWSMNAAVE